MMYVTIFFIGELFDCESLQFHSKLWSYPRTLTRVASSNHHSCGQVLIVGKHGEKSQRVSAKFRQKKWFDEATLVRNVFVNKGECFFRSCRWCVWDIQDSSVLLWKERNERRGQCGLWTLWVLAYVVETRNYSVNCKIATKNKQRPD